jgi:hypothetical protein
MFTIPSVAERRAVEIAREEELEEARAPEVTPEELLAGIFSAVHDFTYVIQQHDDMAAAILHLDSPAAL